MAAKTVELSSGAKMGSIGIYFLFPWDSVVWFYLVTFKAYLRFSP